MSDPEQLQWRVKRIENNMEIFSKTIESDVRKIQEFRPKYLDEVGRIQKKLTGGIVVCITVILGLVSQSFIKEDFALSLIAFLGVFGLGGFLYYERKMEKEEQDLILIENGWDSVITNIQALRSSFSYFTYHIEKITPSQLEIFQVFFRCFTGCVRLPLIESYEKAMEGRIGKPQKKSFTDDIEIIRSIANEYYPYYLQSKEMLYKDASLTPLLSLLEPYRNFKK